MNLIKNIPPDKKSALSKLGLNMFALRNNNRSVKASELVLVSDVLHIIDIAIECLEKDKYEFCYYICDTRIFKKETILKNIYTRTNNVSKSVIVMTLKCPLKEAAMRDRLMLMRQILVNVP